jgi:hypothetical protein
VIVTVVIVAMLQSRDWALEQLGTPKSLSDWQEWREDVRQHQDQPGPVQRRVPKSAEPPALVMMRDHFAVSLIGAVLFSTMLYWVLAGFAMGMLKSGKPRGEV